MEPKFAGPSYTLGIEEELMILGSESLELVNAADDLVEDAPDGEIKPELMQSVLEIATKPCADTREAGAQIRGLRRQVRDSAAQRGLTIGSAGTHPTPRWEGQRITPGERSRHLVSDLRFVVRQELLFGLHVHVGIDDAEKAIHVANGMRVHLPILLALSANSPFWRGSPTGLMSSRTPIFKQLPRVGIPPRFDNWSEYQARIEFMVEAGAVADYTYVWWDVRPHPTRGTVEVRSCAAQTRLTHTVALAALIQAMCRELAESYQSGYQLGTFPREVLEENKWLPAPARLPAQ